MNSPLIIALDVESRQEALALVRKIGSAASFYKVGLELYSAAGMDLVGELKAEGLRVFLDLKFYDIGETVKRAVAQIARSGADFLTIHSHSSVMRAAVEGKNAHPLALLAVTVLTSFDDNDLKDDGYSRGVSELVELRARNAMKAGVNGLICSAVEVGRLRSICGPDMILVTPGVRSPGASSGDQKRIATPAEAIASGASYLVIGRQVTRSQDPQGEVKKILDEIAANGIRPPVLA